MTRLRIWRQFREMPLIIPKETSHPIFPKARAINLLFHRKNIVNFQALGVDLLKVLFPGWRGRVIFRRDDASEEFGANPEKCR